MLEKANVFGQIDLFQKFLKGHCRSTQTAVHFPQELIDKFKAIGNDDQSNTDALVLLKCTNLFNVNWDMENTENDLLRLKDGLVDWFTGIKFIDIPHPDGKANGVPVGESELFGKLMLNFNLFKLGVKKTLELSQIDTFISVDLDAFDTERLRWLVSVEVGTNNIEHSILNTDYQFPLVNEKEHEYVYSTNIGIVVLMTVVGFLGLLCITSAINSFPPLTNEAETNCKKTHVCHKERPCGR